MKLLILSLCLALASHASAADSLRYTVTDLGILPGFQASQANAVNNRGQVTGELIARNYTTHAFFYSHGELKDLGGLGSSAHRAKGYGVSSWGSAINNQGEVTGRAYVDDNLVHAFLYSHGKMHDLGILAFFMDGQPDEWVGSSGDAINNKGQISGTSSDSDGYGRVFLYSKGHMSNIGMPPGENSDYGFPWFTVLTSVRMNDCGEVAITIDGPYRSHATLKSRLYLFKNGKFRRQATLSDPNQFVSVVINNHGIIAGYYVKNQRYCGFREAHGKMQKIGTLPHCQDTEVRAINTQGQIVGCSGDNAFLYSRGKLMDLNDLIAGHSGWVLRSANGINDKGQIVGMGLHHGQQRAFVLTPF